MIKTNENVLLQSSQELICCMMKERNAGTDDCITTTNLAREIGIPRVYIADYLVSIGLLCQVAHRKKATRKAIENGFSMNRSRFEYNCKGRLKEIEFPVWTPEGVDYIKRKLRIKNL